MRDPLNVTKLGAVMPVSRELLIDFGLVQQTPTEQAEHEARMAEWRAEIDAAQPGIRAALAALDALTGIESEMLELHARTQADECAGCDFGGYEGEPPSWPCRTVDLIAARHGIDLSNFHLYDSAWEDPSA